MSMIALGSRRLPPQHVTVRVRWRDGSWTGSVRKRLLNNTSCLILAAGG